MNNGILIKYCRQLANLTQKQLGNQIGLHHSIISRVEAGSIPVTKETEAKLLQVFSDNGIDVQIVKDINILINNAKQEIEISKEEGENNDH